MILRTLPGFSKRKSVNGKVDGGAVNVDVLTSGGVGGLVVSAVCDTPIVVT